MNLNKVYRGITRDGKKRLLYKMIDLRNKFILYKDLESGKKFTAYSVLEDDLVPFKEHLNVKIRKRKVIDLYKADKNKFYNTYNLFVGDLCLIEWKHDIVDEYFSQNNYPMDVKVLEYNILLIKLNDNEYQDLKTKEIFKVRGNEALEDGELCVDNLRNGSKELYLNEEEVVNKDLILRKSYKKFKGIK